ncbi:MAG: pantoate--beta-alanine ligase [Flavobacteriaceae bacterium]
MKVFKKHLRLKEALELQQNGSIGLVPTMGALHAGHLALVERAVKENTCVIVSIFVNPTQFNDQKDLNAYPKTLSDDLQKLTVFGNSVWVYAPEVEDLYPEKTAAELYDFGSLENTMEGAHRSGHFQGVATVVYKLFSCFMPTRAYFGEKDYQQLSIIHALVAQKKLPISIVNCPIIREDDGLAMSSRNSRLTQEQRALAPLIYKVLLQAKAWKKEKNVAQINEWVERYFKEHPAFELDYFCIANAQSLQPAKRLNDNEKTRAFIAVKLGEVRLIDNVNF